MHSALGYGWSRAVLTTIAATVVATILGVGTALPAHAAVEPTVDRLILEGQHTRVVLTFDGGISPDEADEIRSDLGMEREPADVGPLDLNGWPLGCGHKVSNFDSNGRFDIAYNCSGTRRSLPWGFRISAAVQAIIVGNVSEDGLRWWRNGVSQPKNSPHTVPPSYQFHGTMTPVYSGNDIDYQDYMTFRHNVGGGGSGSLAFAGSVVLTN